MSADLVADDLLVELSEAQEASAKMMSIYEDLQLVDAPEYALRAVHGAIVSGLAVVAGLQVIDADIDDLKEAWIGARDLACAIVLRLDVL